MLQNLSLKPVLIFGMTGAAVHFLTIKENSDKYVSIADKAINKNGYLILGTFFEQGSDKCSGLKVKRYYEASISYRFERSFTRIKYLAGEHKTPFNTTQNFLFWSFQKK